MIKHQQSIEKLSVLGVSLKEHISCAPVEDIIATSIVVLRVSILSFKSSGIPTVKI